MLTFDCTEEKEDLGIIHWFQKDLNISIHFIAVRGCTKITLKSMQIVQSDFISGLLVIFLVNLMLFNKIQDLNMVAFAESALPVHCYLKQFILFACMHSKKGTSDLSLAMICHHIKTMYLYSPL